MPRPQSGTERGLLAGQSTQGPPRTRPKNAKPNPRNPERRKTIERSGDVKTSYPRLRLEIHLRWTPRANALAKCTCGHEEPRIASIEFVSSKSSTKYTPSTVVLALVFPSHHKPLSPLHQKWATLGSTVALYLQNYSACGTPA